MYCHVCLTYLITDRISARSFHSRDGQLAKSRQFASGIRGSGPDPRLLMVQPLCWKRLLLSPLATSSREVATASRLTGGILCNCEPHPSLPLSQMASTIVTICCGNAEGQSSIWLMRRRGLAFFAQGDMRPRRPAKNQPDVMTARLTDRNAAK